MGGDGAHTRAEADVTVPHIDQEERGGEFGHGDGPKKDFVPSSGLTSDGECAARSPFAWTARFGSTGLQHVRYAHQKRCRCPVPE